MARSGDGYLMSLPALSTEPKALPEVIDALGCDAQETRWHPNRYALIVVRDEAQVRIDRIFRAAALRHIPHVTRPSAAPGGWTFTGPSHPRRGI